MWLDAAPRPGAGRAATPFLPALLHPAARGGTGAGGGRLPHLAPLPMRRQARNLAAIVRALFRRSFFTQEHMLDWVTSARTPPQAARAWATACRGWAPFCCVPGLVESAAWPCSPWRWARCFSSRPGLARHAKSRMRRPTPDARAGGNFYANSRGTPGAILRPMSPNGKTPCRRTTCRWIPPVGAARRTSPTNIGALSGRLPVARA